MVHHRAAWFVVAAILATSPPSAARDAAGELTLDQALATARERAPALLAARLRVEEARGGLKAASVRLRENPVVDAAAGTRRAAGDSTEVELGVMQTFETGGQRGARIAAASAAVDRAAADVDAATRALLRDVAIGFYGALHATEHLRLARETEKLSQEALRTAERRNELGEVPLLDVHVARVGWAGDRSAIGAAEARTDAALRDLRLLLGVAGDEVRAVAGDLRTRRSFDLETLLARAAERPELRGLVAELREAEAEVQLGRGERRPDLGLGVRYEREGGEDLLLGAVSIELPVFERGQGARAQASARSRRLQVELEAARRTIEVQVRSAFDAWQHRASAVEAIERDGLASLAETEQLAQRAYEKGAFGMGELLVLRRETVEMRRRHLDHLLDAAVAAIELEAAAGSTTE
jgi:cobalt-zinc-cadmium efflux system outer membrane protein